MDAQSEIRKRHAEREKRRGALAVTVVTALATRDAQVQLWEKRAGDALNAMVEEEGLTVGEAVEWCADRVSVREAARLRQGASPTRGHV